MWNVKIRLTTCWPTTGLTCLWPEESPKETLDEHLQKLGYIVPWCHNALWLKQSGATAYNFTQLSQHSLNDIFFWSPPWLFCHAIIEFTISRAVCASPDGLKQKNLLFEFKMFLSNKLLANHRSNLLLAGGATKGNLG